MPGFFQEHLRPLAGAAGMHLVLFGLLGVAALQWTSSQPPVQLAIEGYVADEPVVTRPAAPRSSPAPQPPPPAERRPPPEPAPAPVEQSRAQDEAAARAAQAAREQRQAEERATQRAREQAAAEQRQAEAAERRRAAAAEAERKAAEEAARRQAEAAEAKRRTEERAQAEREAKQRAEREADLQRLLAAEEEAASMARSGVVDEYRLMLTQAIERSWIRPPSAQAGLQCTLYVTQAPGGTVVDVKLGPCNGDQVVRESITTAVFKASPLPAPRDPRAFERRLEIVFRPME